MKSKFNFASFIFGLSLLILTVLGGALRFADLGRNPSSLNVDEVSIGYNAYSILQTGRDEDGNPWPLSFRSLGDYKPPFYIYLTALSEAIFGMNEWAVRFPSALFGMLSIPLFCLFFKELTGKKEYALAGAALLAISPWHLYYSRIASEAQVADFLIVAGVYCLMKLLKGRVAWLIPAALLLGLSMYTYHSPRLFTPLLVLIVLILNWKKIWQTQLSRWFAFLGLLTLFCLPLIASLLFGADSTRVQMTVITKDPDFLRKILIQQANHLDNLQSVIYQLFGTDKLLLFFYWLRKYLAYFQPSFLFYSSLNMTTPGTYGPGIMYLFEAPLLIWGVVLLAKNKIPNRSLILGWILAGLIPTSLTLNEQHSIRTLVILPMTVLVSAFSGVTLFELIRQKLGLLKAAFVYGLAGVFIAVNLLQVFLVFAIHLPMQKGEAFMEGTKEAVEYVLQNQSRYSEVVFDPVRGIDGPYLVNVPHLYYLFYGKVEPALYQSASKKNDKWRFQL